MHYISNLILHQNILNIQNMLIMNSGKLIWIAYVIMPWFVREHNWGKIGNQSGTCWRMSLIRKSRLFVYLVAASVNVESLNLQFQNFGYQVQRHPFCFLPVCANLDLICIVIIGNEEICIIFIIAEFFQSC